MPAFINPFKKEFFAPPEKRLEWLERIYADTPHVKVLSFEIEQGRKTATIETVRFLESHYAISKLYLIIGADNYASFHQWQNHEELQRHCEIVVATRSGYMVDEDVKTLAIERDISSTQLRRHYNQELVPKEIAAEAKEYYKN